MNKLTNIYKSGGVKQASLDSSCDDVNPFTHTCGRLFARKTVQKVAFVVSILFLTGACQQAYLIPDEDAEEYTGGARGEDGEAPKDSTNVDIDFDANGWGGAIDVGFEFGGSEQGN